MESAIEGECPRTVSLEKARLELSIGRTTAYQQAQDGTFPARVFKVGNRWRVSVRSLNRLIDGGDGDDDRAT